MLTDVVYLFDGGATAKMIAEMLQMSFVLIRSHPSMVGLRPLAAVTVNVVYFFNVDYI